MTRPADQAASPTLREGFLKLDFAASSEQVGYGRKLTPTEEQHLTMALASIPSPASRTARTHGDREVLERGRRTLARLRAEDHH